MIEQLKSNGLQESRESIALEKGIWIEDILEINQNMVAFKDGSWKSLHFIHTECKEGSQKIKLGSNIFDVISLNKDTIAIATRDSISLWTTP